MTATPPSTTEHQEPVVYEIRIKGHHDVHWADRHGGLVFTQESD